MSPWKALCETVHFIALGVWLGVLAASGAFAASVFPVMRELDPRLPAYSAYAGEHWLIAGGAVNQRIFLITDIVQFVCAVLAMGTLGCLIGVFGLARRRPATLLRALALGVAMACAAGTIIIVAPQLNAALRLYWAAARAGDAASVAVHRAAVDQLHPIATRLMAGTLACVFVSLAAGLWGTLRAWSEPQPPRESGYERPMLAGRRRA